ncbi:MAG: ATP-binding protein [Thermodesulfobacteriota bacterium]|nr:ATP-binding protein [Thermodesulfobacteriota bacterium]
MGFVNREEELVVLEKLYKEEAFQFVVLYGRRRVGKTRLVQEFIEGKPAIYFLADSISESEQLKNLGREVGEFLNDPRKWGQS